MGAMFPIPPAYGLDDLRDYRVISRDKDRIECLSRCRPRQTWTTKGSPPTSARTARNLFDPMRAGMTATALAGWS